MIPFPEIRPYLVKIGPIEVRWYGLMYLLGFASSYFLVKHQVRRKGMPLTGDDIGSLFTMCILGLLLGARLGYVVFYNLTFYLEHPLDVAAVWQGGMSFHGGLIGSLLAGYLFSRRHGIRPLVLSEVVIPTIPLGLFFGRLGNFINGELFGRVTELPWAMVFPLGGDVPRHPSQLYEAFFEGPFLFAVLWILKDRARREGVTLGVFLFLYGLMRFAIEFTREPDPQLGFVAGPLTMGQMLCAAMMAGGLLLLGWKRDVKS